MRIREFDEQESFESDNVRNACNIIRGEREVCTYWIAVANILHLMWTVFTGNTASARRRRVLASITDGSLLEAASSDSQFYISLVNLVIDSACCVDPDLRERLLPSLVARAVIDDRELDIVLKRYFPSFQNYVSEVIIPLSIDSNSSS
jgi:hypothetical protein